MAFSLYDATVANYLQILGAVDGLMTKSLAHFHDKGIDPAEVVEARLASDMLPFQFQVSRWRIIRAAPWRRRRPACSCRHRATPTSILLHCRRW